MSILRSEYLFQLSELLYFCLTNNCDKKFHKATGIAINFITSQTSKDCHMQLLP